MPVIKDLSRANVWIGGVALVVAVVVAVLIALYVVPPVRRVSKDVTSVIRQYEELRPTIQQVIRDKTVEKVNATAQQVEQILQKLSGNQAAASSPTRTATLFDYDPVPSPRGMRRRR